MQFGTAALAEGDRGAAYEHLRRVFTQDAPPLPVHHHASSYYLADLAAAAVRAGRADDARAVLLAVEDHLGSPRSGRLDAIVHRATALLGRPDDAEIDEVFDALDEQTVVVPGTATLDLVIPSLARSRPSTNSDEP